MNKLFYSILLFFMTLPLMAVSSYTSIEGKAQRFFQHQEWGSALAMYDLMLSDKPIVNTFNHAIVVAGILDKKDQQMELMLKTENMGIPLDSVFNGVRDISISLVKPELYVDFLNLVKSEQPWLARNINTHLLNYYTFRGDYAGTIEVANILLATTPNNIEYLSDVANAYMMMGNFEYFRLTTDRIIQIDPQNRDALLAMGNYYFYRVNEELKSQKIDINSINKQTIQPIVVEIQDKCPNVMADIKSAQSYFTRARKIFDTPYLQSIDNKLSMIINPPRKR